MAYTVPFPKPIEVIISDCVASVSTAILPSLIVANPNIQTLSFMHGHPLELIQTLKEKTESKTAKYEKFPVVMLFEDTNVTPPSVKGAFQDVSLNIVIAMSTVATYKADKRITENFIPILRPIYFALINKIFSCGYFHVQSVNEITGNAIERLFWGTQGLYGNSANVFDDHLDAIEIKNLKLTQSRPGRAA